MLCNALYVTLLVVLLSENVLSFALNMGGGRSPAEKGVSVKGMFKELRNKRTVFKKLWFHMLLKISFILRVYSNYYTFDSIYKPASHHSNHNTTPQHNPPRAALGEHAEPLPILFYSDLWLDRSLV
jgi:hypothetical protein